MSPTTMTMIAATIALAATPARAHRPGPDGRPSDSPPAAVEADPTPAETPNPPAGESPALDAAAPAGDAHPNGLEQNSGAGGATNVPGPTDAWSTLDRLPAAGTGAPAAQLAAEVGSSTVEAPDRSRRWRISASLGIHDCTGAFCDDGLDTAPFFGQTFDFYLRLNDYVALGAGFSALEMMPDSDDVTGNFFAGTAGIQGFLPLTERLDLWGGLAAGYGGTLIEEERRSGYSYASDSLTFHGPVVAFAAGLDFWVGSWLALGPSFTYDLTLWQEICETDVCTDWDRVDPAVRDAATLDYWMLAFRTTATI